MITMLRAIMLLIMAIIMLPIQIILYSLQFFFLIMAYIFTKCDGGIGYILGGIENGLNSEKQKLEDSVNDNSR